MTHHAIRQRARRISPLLATNNFHLAQAVENGSPTKRVVIADDLATKLVREPQSRWPPATFARRQRERGTLEEAFPTRGTTTGSRAD